MKVAMRGVGLLGIALTILAGGCGARPAAPTASRLSSPSPAPPAIHSVYKQDYGLSPSVWWRRGSKGWAGMTSASGTIGLATTVRRVSATWVEPRVLADDAARDAVSVWVGLSDRSTRSLVQIGVEAATHSATLYVPWRTAFYEMFPQPPVPFYTVTVRAGDTLTATVAQLSSGWYSGYRLTLRNDTTGAQFATTQQAFYINPTEGDIIVEKPKPRVGDVALPNFSPVHFTVCSFNGQRIARFRLTKIDMVAKHHHIAVASIPGADGASFTVWRTGP